MRVDHKTVALSIPSESPSAIATALTAWALAVNDRITEIVVAINSNEASAIVVEGTSSGDLPTPELGLRGRFGFVSKGAGVRDELYVCRKNAADAYEWAAVTVP